MKVELCAASSKALLAAKKYQVDRIELCQNLEFGGTSPSWVLVEQALELGLETHVLIRPRIGGFIYSSEEKEILLREIEWYIKLGVHGVVIGAYDEKYELERPFLAEARSVIGNLDTTFHRAFDSMKDWQKNLDTLIELGFKRVLTSGLASSVDLGMNKLEEMTQYAKEAIEIMPGGGVNESNIKKIYLDVQPPGLHFSATSMIQDVDQAIFSAPRLEIDEAKIEKWMKAINQLKTF